MGPAKGIGEAPKLDGSDLRVAIVHARWNAEIIGALVGGAKKALSAHGVKDDNIFVESIPGSFELPFAVRGMAMSGHRYDAIIAVGVLIKGETMHFEYIADAVSHALMKVQMDTYTPVVFGLLTVLSLGQGLARAGLTERGHNHGEDWGAAAVELATKNRIWGRR